MTLEEAIRIIKHYIACSVCVSHKAEEDLFRLLRWLEDGGGLNEDDGR